MGGKHKSVTLQVFCQGMDIKNKTAFKTFNPTSVKVRAKLASEMSIYYSKSVFAELFLHKSLYLCCLHEVNTVKLLK